MSLISALQKFVAHVLTDGAGHVLGTTTSPVHVSLDSDTLTVGTPSAGYTGDDANWMDIDGTNPPTFPKIRLIDQVTGDAVVVTVDDGVLNIDGAGND